MRSGGDRRASSRSSAGGRARGHPGKLVSGGGARERGGAGAPHGRHLHGSVGGGALAPAPAEAPARSRPPTAARGWVPGCAAAGGAND